MQKIAGKVPSIKINLILNFLRIFSAVIVGLLTMPYITRVLGAEYLGKVEYVNTIVNYFVLFSALGIPMYGIREVSKRRDSKEDLYKFVSELYIILFCTTLISYVIIFSIINLDIFSNYRDLILIMSSMVFLSNAGAEWYFQGTENQKFITVRYITVRFLVFILIFIFIKEVSDYKKYAFLLVLLGFGANVINFFALGYRLFREKILIKDLNIVQHLRPISTIFLATISINIYLQLDNFLIGSLSGDKYVGYYAMSNKLIRYAISFVTIVGSVMLPRLSFLYLNDQEQYYLYLKKSLNLMMILSIPCSIFFYLFSEEIIMFMAGNEFKPSVLTMQILSPLCIIVSLAYFFGFLVLYPQGREKIYTKATIFSAIFSVLINFYAVKNFQQNGAAVIAVLAEFLAIAIMYIYIKKSELIKLCFDNNMTKIFLINLSLFTIFFIARSFYDGILDFQYFLIYTVTFVIAYAILLILFKEKNVLELLGKLPLIK